MDTDSEKVESLPSRPLSEPEVERLAETASKDVVFMPTSMMSTDDGGRGVTTMVFFRREGKTLTYLGWNPEIEGWSKFETIDRDDYTQAKSNEIIDEWARETYGEEDVSHSSYEL